MQAILELVVYCPRCKTMGLSISLLQQSGSLETGKDYCVTRWEILAVVYFTTVPFLESI